MFENSFLISFSFFFFGFRDADDHPGWVKYIHLDGNTYYRHMSGRLLTPDDVTQPRIRECLERLLTLTASTLQEQNLLADLPRDFEIVAERMDPRGSGGILFRLAESEAGHQLRVRLSMRPQPDSSSRTMPKPEAPYVTLPFFSSSGDFMCAFFIRVGEDARDALLETSGLVPYAHHRTASTL